MDQPKEFESENGAPEGAEEARTRDTLPSIQLNLLRAGIAPWKLITAAVFAVIAGARSVGSLEELELGTYDWLLRSRPLIQLEDNPVVLIRLREEEIQKYGHPLCDARMAVALAKLQELGRLGGALGIDRAVIAENTAGQAVNVCLDTDGGGTVARFEIHEV